MTVSAGSAAATAKKTGDNHLNIAQKKKKQTISTALSSKQNQKAPTSSHKPNSFIQSANFNSTLEKQLNLSLIKQQQLPQRKQWLEIDMKSNEILLKLKQ